MNLKRVAQRATKVLGLVDLDTYMVQCNWSTFGCKYFITFIDDLCRYYYVYLMKQKSKAFDIYIYILEICRKSNES